VRIVLLKALAVSGCVLALTGALAALHRLNERSLLKLRRFDTLALWMAARLVPILIVYFALGFKPESDVATCFWPQAVGAASGHMPYRDFESFFSPAFPYLLALPTFLFHDPRVLILWLSLFEAVTIHLTARLAGLSDPSKQRVRLLLCAFVAPGPLLLSVIGGQEDFLLWTSGLLIWGFVARKSDLAASATGAACALLTKATIVVPLAAFLGMSRSRVRFLSILSVVGVVTATSLWKLTGTAFLAVLSQGGNISPPQIWLLLHLLTAGAIPAGTNAISLIVVGGIVLAALGLGARLRDVLVAEFPPFAGFWVTLFAALIILSPKSQGAYFGYLALPLLTLVANDRRGLLLWLVTGALVVVEPSLFYRTGELHPAHWSQIGSMEARIDIALQFVLVGCFSFFAWYAWSVTRDSVRQFRFVAVKP